MTSEQPMPAPGRQDVTPVARELFASMLAEREAKGIRTYGTTLQTHNGRDAVQDALEGVPADAQARDRPTAE